MSARSRPTWATIGHSDRGDEPHLGLGTHDAELLHDDDLSQAMTDAVGGLMQMASASSIARPPPPPPPPPAPSQQEPQSSTGTSTLSYPGHERIGVAAADRFHGHGHAATPDRLAEADDVADESVDGMSSMTGSTYTTTTATRPTAELGDPETASLTAETTNTTTTAAAKSRNQGPSGKGKKRAAAAAAAAATSDAAALTSKPNKKKKTAQDSSSSAHDHHGNEHQHNAYYHQHANIPHAPGTGGPGGVTKNQPQYHVLKMEDGEMCTRADIQYDFLEAIFSDPTPAFTPPRLTSHPRPIPRSNQALPKFTFGQLYCYTLAGSPRATKSSKEALMGLEPGTLPGKNKAGTAAALAAKRRKEAANNGVDLTKLEQAAGVANSTPGSTTGSGNWASAASTVYDDATSAGGGDDDDVENYDGLKDGLSKVCIMINIGRINTTFAFYPLMRTMLRSYHSIPSLQKSIATRRALQDAPRLKIMLKAVTLANEEYKTMPTSLNKIAELAEKGKCPSTNICNLLLAFALRPEPAHEKWFSEYPPNVNLLNLFTPLTISSKEKAKAFLFVMHEYLEGPNSPNPFSDPSHPGQMPRLTILSQEAYDALGENVDTPEEIQFGIEMKAQRIQCVADLAQRKEEEERARELAGPVEQVVLPGYPPVEDDSPELPKAKLAAARKSKGKKRKVGEVAADGDASSLTDSSKAHWRRDLYNHSRHDYYHRHVPFDDEWAMGIETLGLDDATVQGLIHQVNHEAVHWQARYRSPPLDDGSGGGGGEGRHVHKGYEPHHSAPPPHRDRLMDSTASSLHGERGVPRHPPPPPPLLPLHNEVAAPASNIPPSLSVPFTPPTVNPTPVTASDTPQSSTTAATSTATLGGGGGAVQPPKTHSLSSLLN